MYFFQNGATTFNVPDSIRLKRLNLVFSLSISSYSKLESDLSGKNIEIITLVYPNVVEEK